MGGDRQSIWAGADYRDVLVGMADAGILFGAPADPEARCRGQAAMSNIPSARPPILGPDVAVKL